MGGSGKRLRRWLRPVIVANTVASTLVIGAVALRIHAAGMPPGAIRLEQVLVGAGVAYAIPAMAVRALRWTGHRRTQTVLMASSTVIAMAVLGVAAPYLPDFLPLTCIVFATMVLNFDLGFEAEAFAAVAGIPALGVVGLWAYYVVALHGDAAAVLVWSALLLGASILVYVTLRVVLERRSLAEARVKTLLESVAEAIMTIDPAGVIESANPAAFAMFGYAAGRLEGRPARELIAPDDAAGFEAYLGRAARGQEAPGMLESVARRTDGETFPIDLLVSPMRTDQGLRYVLAVRDVSTQRAVVNALEQRALHDALTLLPNRTLFQDRLNQALEAAQRSGSVFAVLLLDLDRFQDVNDVFGHDAGDQLLARVAERVRRVCRGADTVARLAGDEFAILTGLSQGPHDPITLGRKILGELAPAFQVAGRDVKVGASIGVALYPDHGQDARMLVRRADMAMYAAKAAPARLAIFKDEQERSTSRRLLLAGELERALTKGELTLLYQPVVDLVTGRVVKYEALVRWIHPEQGWLGPTAFIPLSEETGVIGQITQWVLNAALTDVGRWQSGGPRVGVTVNISAHDLKERDFVARVAQALHRQRVSADLLTIELTEGQLLAVEASAKLKQLRELGVRLALDDFGTGYSSLAYLGRLPLDYLKIDKSFVETLASHDDSETIVRSSIELGHSLGLKLIAEGVETDAARARLLALHCDYGQGYLFGRPQREPLPRAAGGWLPEGSVAALSLNPES